MQLSQFINETRLVYWNFTLFQPVADLDLDVSSIQNYIVQFL